MAELVYVYALLDRRVAPPTVGGVRPHPIAPFKTGPKSAPPPKGVRPGSDPLPARGLTPRQRRIEIVDVGGVFAAVERMGDAPPLNEQALRDQHQIVVHLARTAGAILPVRFGTFVDREELERLIDTRRAVLRQALRKVHGKAQMTVRVFGRSARTPPTQTPSSGTEYLRARAALSKPRLPKIAQAIVDAVQPFVSAEIIDGGKGSVRVTINHLVDRRRVSKYLAAVVPLVGELPPSATHDLRSTTRDPRTTVTGPWPPFAFVPDLLSSAMPLERLTP